MNSPWPDNRRTSIYRSLTAVVAAKDRYPVGIQARSSLPAHPARSDPGHRSVA
jgi:hypothetical protein